jgi:hypothetical protein
VVNEVAIRLNVDLDESTFDLLAGGKGVISAEDTAKKVLRAWAKEQQRLFKRSEVSRRLDRTPALVSR